MSTLIFAPPARNGGGNIFTATGTMEQFLEPWDGRRGLMIQSPSALKLCFGSATAGQISLTAGEILQINSPPGSSVWVQAVSGSAQFTIIEW